MQANSIRINTWDALFTLFTTLEPEGRKMLVLRAIADPKTEIGHSWGDCLFAVAARAAGRSILSITCLGKLHTVARALGIPVTWVSNGIEVWDGRQDSKQRDRVMIETEAFRNRIREHLANLEEAKRETDKVMEQARRANRFVERVRQALGQQIATAPPSPKKKAGELVSV